MVSLSIVATPIGNLNDISVRALEVLKSADVIVCEDTRVSGTLLSHFGIRKEQPPLSLHHHSEEGAFEKVFNALKEGKSVAYITDAGTPGVNDPGGKLVEYISAHAPEISIVPIPGPNAAVTLASVSGIPMDTYCMMGFPPHKKGRKAFFEKVLASEDPVIFYESTHRILKSLEELQKLLPASETRWCIVGRELTKRHETIIRGTIEQVFSKLQGGETRGEFVVVVSRWTPKL